MPLLSSATIPLNQPRLFLIHKSPSTLAEAGSQRHLRINWIDSCQRLRICNIWTARCEGLRQSEPGFSPGRSILRSLASHYLFITSTFAGIKPAHGRGRRQRREFQERRACTCTYTRTEGTAKLERAGSQGAKGNSLSHTPSRLAAGLIISDPQLQTAELVGVWVGVWVEGDRTKQGRQAATGKQSSAVWSYRSFLALQQL